MSALTAMKIWPLHGIPKGSPFGGGLGGTPRKNTVGRAGGNKNPGSSFLRAPEATGIGESRRGMSVTCRNELVAS